MAIFAGALLISACLLAFQVSELASASMLPTLLPGDSVLVNRLIYRLHSPRRGDLIVLHFPQAEGREFVKRVVGLPGDVVGEQGGRIAVNGVTVPQARSDDLEDAHASDMNLRPRRVPPDQLYVLGDNPETSLDSRSWGTVDEREVVGKVVLICWSHGKRWWNVRWNRIGDWLQ